MYKIIALSLITLALVSCTKDKTASLTPELNLALTTALPTLDPAVSYDTVSATIVTQIYESLYEYDYLTRPYKLRPLLAVELPKVSNQGKTYTIKIKDNLFYHQKGPFKKTMRKVKAQDFINQLKRVAFKPTRSNGWWLFEKKIIGLDKFREEAKSDFSNFFTLPIKGLTAVDDLTLKIDLISPYPQLTYALAMAFTTPVSQEVIEFYKNDLNHEAIGTGAYVLEEWTKGHRVVLKKNKKYSSQVYPTTGDKYAYKNNLLLDRGKSLPFIETVNFHIIKEAQTRWLKFLNKEIDFILLGKDHFSIAIDKDGKLNKKYRDQKIKLEIAPTLTYWWLSFNMEHDILGKNLKLRQAIAHSIDMDEYIAKFTNNVAKKANSIYPPGVPGYLEETKMPFEFNLQKAKKLIKEAGYPNGKGLPTFKYDIRSNSALARQTADFISGELAQIGIKLKVQMNPFKTFLNKARTKQLEIWQGGWAMDYPDAENVIQLLTTKNHAPGPNTSLYSNKKVDALYKSLSTAKTKDELLEITKEVEDIIGRDLPWIMQYYSRNYILVQNYVQNYRQSDLISNNLKYLRIK